MRGQPAPFHKTDGDVAPAARVGQATCTVARSYEDDLVCGAPATAVATASCVHEHVTAASVCDSCLDWLRRQRMVCVACDELHDDSHICASVLIEVHMLGAVTAPA